MPGFIASQKISEKELMLSFKIPDNYFYDFSNNSGVSRQLCISLEQQKTERKITQNSKLK